MPKEPILTQDHDYRTHHHDWLKACKIAKDAAKTDDDISYWQHQIDTLNKIDKECSREVE